MKNKEYLKLQKRDWIDLKTNKNYDNLESILIEMIDMLFNKLSWLF